MKKLLNYFSVFIFSFSIFMNMAYAAGYSVSVTSSSVTVGNSVTLKIIGNNVTGRFSVSSSNSSVASVSTSSVWVENNTQSITVSTKNTGSATITITPVDVADSSSGDTLNLESKTITIKVNAKPTNNGGTTPPKVKSSNNYLSSLSIDGIELDKKFDKETLEYSATIPAETEKIKINAQIADSNASVTGIGEVKVSAGLNTFEIVVTAENGSKKTYVLKATVLELEPIKVVIDKQEYTVVRKKVELPEISDYFQEKEVTIGEDVVAGYYNEKLDYTVVGLKDSDGGIEYYIYKDGKYTLYKEYTFSGTTLQILDKELDGGYKKTSFMYDSDKINSFQEVKLDIIKNTYAIDSDSEIAGNQYYLFYAKNVESGREYLYQYDALEKTVQRYNTQLLDLYKGNSDTYYMYLIACILIIGILIVGFSIIIIRMNKKNNKKVSKKSSKRMNIEID